MTLDELAFEHGTDKRTGRHGYTPIYETLFQGRDVRNLLEIGVYNGGSHMMWLDYFTKAMIYGIDTDQHRLDRVVCRVVGNPRLVLDLIDQSDRKQLRQWAERINKKFDIVIDDGSHKCSHQIASFETLWPFVVPGGVYVVEDTFTSYWRGHKLGYVDQEVTCVEYFKAMIDQLDLLSMESDVNRRFIDFDKLKNLLDLSDIQQTVESVQFRYGMIVIYKREV